MPQHNTPSSTGGFGFGALAVPPATATNEEVSAWQDRALWAIVIVGSLGILSTLWL